MPESPAIQRSMSSPAPTPRGVTAPTPVIATRGFGARLVWSSSMAGPLRALGDVVDCLAHRVELGEVLLAQLDAVVLLDDLRELDQVERIHVERLEGRIRLDRIALGAELDESLGDPLLDRVLARCCFHCCLLLVGWCVRRSCRRRRSESFR